MTTKKRPKAEEVQRDIKKLQEMGLGEFREVTSNQSVFFKPLPTDELKDKVEAAIGMSEWDNYVEKFTATDEKYTTMSQYNQFLSSSPDQAELEELGIQERTA